MATKKTYKAVENFEFKDEEVKAGELIDLTDKQAEKLLEDGLIEEDVQKNEVEGEQENGVEQSAYYKDSKIVGEVEDVVLKGNQYKRFATENGSGFTLPIEEYDRDVILK